MSSLISSARFPLQYVVMAVCVLVAATDSAHASPVTLRFEAEIGTLANGFPFDSGIDFTTGDVVTGQFTFDPAEGSSSDISYSQIQPYEFCLNVAGVDLSLSDFTVTALNDAPISDFPPANLIDGLELAGIGLTPVPQSVAPNISPSQSGIQIYLKGPSSSFGTPIFAADPSVWNSLAYERQLVVLLGGNDGGAIGFQATIRSFDLVPEPTSGTLCLFILVTMMRRRFG